MLKKSGCLVACIICLSACQKKIEESYNTYVVSADPLEYDNTWINAKFDLQGNTNYVQGGICWSSEPMPDINDNIIEDQYNKSETDMFHIENLYSNETYYVRSYFLFSYTNIQYSPEFQFTTDNIPDPPCPVVDAVIDFGPFNMNMTALVGFQDYLYYSLKTECSIGSIDFRFKELPKSGIYHTSTDFVSLEDFEVSIFGHIQGAWTCVYEATGYDNIYVDNDGNGNISISFCEVPIVTDGGCSANYYIISGKVKNY